MVLLTQGQSQGNTRYLTDHAVCLRTTERA